jgi:hypothetical protein
MLNKEEVRMEEHHRRRVYISDCNFMGTIEISLLYRTPDFRGVEHYYPNERKWQRVNIPPRADTNIGPTLTLDIDDAVALYQRLHEFFAARGVRNKDESFTAGDLKATKYHLEDLRKLLEISKEG